MVIFLYNLALYYDLDEFPNGTIKRELIKINRQIMEDSKAKAQDEDEEEEESSQSEENTVI